MQRIVSQCKTCEYFIKYNKINCICAMKLDCKEGLGMDKQRPGRSLLKICKSER